MYIVFDIGGTKMRVGASSDGETVQKITVLSTPATYEEGIEEFKKAALALAMGEPIDAVAGGLPGMFSKKTGTLLAAPNLKSWVGRHAASELSTAFNAPVYIENDAAVDGLGEALFGAGRGHEIVAYITVSTGVGGSRIVNGKIDAKSLSFEPGHQIIDADKTMIPNASGVLLGDYISGKALFERTGKKPKDIAESSVWEKMARILAFALNNTIAFWSPDVIVLGGSMITGDPAISVDKVRELLPQIAANYRELPVIKIAQLGDESGLLGSLAFLKSMNSNSNKDNSGSFDGEDDNFGSGIIL